MTRLEDFLGPLDEGVWEVSVPKDSVTEPLGSRWKKSRINVPSPGTLASYRKENYHLHETATEWRVHYDRYDPEQHQFLHLIDDAPLILMIGETFLTLAINARSGRDDRTHRILEGQRRAWQFMLITGSAIILAAISVIAHPLHAFTAIISLLIPALITGLGLLIVLKGISIRPPAIDSMGSVLMGLCVAGLGVASGALPLRLWAVLIFVILAIWTFASALVFFRRVSGGRTAVPEGFCRRLILAVFSLILGSLIFLAPQVFLALLLEFLGAILILLGIVFIQNGAELRRRMGIIFTLRDQRGYHYQVICP